MAKYSPIHPGKILSVEFLKELDVTSYALAKAIGVPTNRITGIVNGDRAISADTALRLAQYFGNSPRPGGAIKPGDSLIFECELIEVDPG